MTRPPVLRRRSRLLSTTHVARDTWWLEFHEPDIASTARPGQFIMFGLGLGTGTSWLLPRPFSVGWTGPDGEVGILLRCFGAGTTSLSRLAVGDSALLLGPLGSSFSPGDAGVPNGGETECVAGGVGLAPFIFFAAAETAAGRDVRLVYGERGREAVFDPALLAQLTGTEPELVTEDGSLGRKGRVTDALDPYSSSRLLGCGPTPMLHALADFATRYGRDLQVSVEEHMGCGVGTCQGCVVKGADGRWVKACLEGPVFDLHDLDWSYRP